MAGEESELVSIDLAAQYGGHWTHMAAEHLKGG